MKVKLGRDRFVLWMYLGIFLQPLVYRKHVAAESEKASLERIGNDTNDEPVITTERYGTRYNIICYAIVPQLVCIF